MKTYLLCKADLPFLPVKITLNGGEDCQTCTVLMLYYPVNARTTLLSMDMVS